VVSSMSSCFTRLMCMMTDLGLVIMFQIYGKPHNDQGDQYLRWQLVVAVRFADARALVESSRWPICVVVDLKHKTVPSSVNRTASRH
jgi:hypothetical protein